MVERIDAELDEASRQEVEKFFERFDGDAPGSGVIDVQRIPPLILGVRPGIERRHVDPELGFLQLGGKLLPDLLLEMLAAGEIHPPFLALFFQHRAVGHFPLHVPAQDARPLVAQPPFGCMAGFPPSPYLFEQ